MPSSYGIENHGSSMNRWQALLMSPLSSGPQFARSPSFDARSASRGARTRSLSRDQRGRSAKRRSSRGAHEQASELRCTSEPPQQSAADLFDDPFEPPPQEDRWAMPMPMQMLPVLWTMPRLGNKSGDCDRSAHSGHPHDAPDVQPSLGFRSDPVEAMVPTQTTTTARLTGREINEQLTSRLQRWASPVQSGPAARSPSFDARAASHGTRARSLSREQRGRAWRRRNSRTARERSNELRCTSEPPQQGIADLSPSSRRPRNGGSALARLCLACS